MKEVMSYWQLLVAKAAEVSTAVSCVLTHRHAHGWPWNLDLMSNTALQAKTVMSHYEFVYTGWWMLFFSEWAYMCRNAQLYAFYEDSIIQYGFVSFSFLGFTITYLRYSRFKGLFRTTEPVHNWDQLLYLHTIATALQHTHTHTTNMLWMRKGPMKDLWFSFPWLPQTHIKLTNVSTPVILSYFHLVLLPAPSSHLVWN